MAFKGDLASISLFDVFQTLNTNHQSGVLVLRREGVMKKIYFSPEGVRIFFTKSARPLRLGEVFVRRGKVTPQDIEILLMQQKQEYRPIGELLVSTGKVSAEEISQTLRYHAEDEIFEVFGWERGSFAFFDRDPEEERSNTPLSEVVLDAGGLCLEAARRLDDIEHLRELIPSDRAFYRQVDGAALDLEATDAAVIDVFDTLSEPNSVDDLRDIVSSTQFHVLGALAQLRRIEVVRPLDSAELLEEGRSARTTGRYERAARLIDLALECDPQDTEMLQESVAVLERLDDAERIADRLAQLGARRAADAMHAEAIEPLERAIHHVPDHAEALLALRDCFAELGDSEQAAEISLRLARKYSTEEDDERALEACRVGVAISPDSVTLRYHYAQLLARSNKETIAQSELRELVDESLRQKTALRTRRTRELLTACYSLLLRIDPEDDLARTGLKELQSQSSERVHRRKLYLRIGIGAAALLLVSGIGFTLMPPSAEELLAEAYALKESGDIVGLEEVLGRIESDHPDSSEASAARKLRKSLDGGAAERAAEAKREQQAAVTEEYKTLLDQLLKQLGGGELDDAVTELNFFLRRLAEPRASFLRARMIAPLKVELEQFLERAEKLATKDRGFVSACERQVMQGSGTLLRDLAKAESRLAEVRRRNWAALSATLAGKLTEALDSGQLSGMEKRIEKTRKSMITVGPAFGGLDPLYFKVRSLHLREKIRSSVTEAKTEGRILLGRCEFEAALELYRAAYAQADAASQEHPRMYFKDLNNWISDRNLLPDLGRRIESIEQVGSSLRLLEELIAQGREDAGFRLLRDLVSNHRLVQFERRYQLPYRVTSEPAGADVLVDGKKVGKTPCAVTMDIAQGIRVRVEAPGFESVEADLNITNPELDGLLAVTLHKLDLWQHDLRGAPEARPVIVGDLVLVPTNEASLVALRAKNGSVAWEAESKLLDRIKAPPLVGKAHAHFVTVGGRLFSVRLEDGRIVHRLDLPGEVHYAGQIVDGTIYLATRNRKLLAIRAGRILFSRDMKYGTMTSMARVGDELVMATAEGVLLVFDRHSGRQVRELAPKERASFFGGLTVNGNRILAVAEDGNLYCFRVDRSKPLWKFRLSGPLSAPPLARNDTIYLPLRDGFMVRLTKDGKRLDRLDFRNSAAGSPVLRAGIMYVPAGTRLVAFDMQANRRWWEIDNKTEAPIHVAAGPDLIVAVTDSGRVIAYPADNR